MKVVFSFSCILILALNLQAQNSDFTSADFTKADGIAEQYPKHSLKNLPLLAHKLTSSLPTDHEKFRSIYKWVCNNIGYDYELFQKNKDQRAKLITPEERKAWNDEFSIRVFKTLVEKQRTVCTGYAYLVKELSYHAGLSAVIIDGYGRTTQSNVGGDGVLNHSWNGINLNGKWYLCDPTWSSGAYYTVQAEYVKKYTNDYFLADPSLFVLNHYPKDSSWTLIENIPTLREFLDGPLIYSTAYQHGINEMRPRKFEVQAVKGQVVSFEFNTTGTIPIDKVEVEIKRASTSTKFSPSTTKNENGNYQVEYNFKSKGVHIVHLVVNGSYAISYRVDVK